MRIVFMGTPVFAVPALEVLSRDHQMIAVYTQPDRPVGRGLELSASPVKRKAQELGIPVFQPEKLTPVPEFEKLVQLKPDVIVVVAYGKILRKNILDLPRFGCINLHSSLLPRWRGAAPIHWAMLEGDVQTGVSSMLLVEELDAGDVLLQAPTPIFPQDTAETLHDRLSSLGANVLRETLQGLEQGTLVPNPQDVSQVTYAEKLTKEMEWLDPSQSALQLERRVKALNPWPGTSLWVSQRLKVKKVTAHSQMIGVQGQVFEKQGRIFLGTAQGSLELLTLQWEGKKEVQASEFLNGLQGRNLKLPIQVQYPAVLH